MSEDILKSLSDEELAKHPGLTVEEIEAAIRKGEADRAKIEPFLRQHRGLPLDLFFRG